MLQFLTIAFRQITHVFALAIKIANYLCSAGLPFKKGVNLVIILGFLHFVFWKKNLWALLVLHKKEM